MDEGSTPLREADDAPGHGPVSSPHEKVATGMLEGKRIETFSDRLRAISRLAAEQGPLLNDQTNPARQRTVAGPGLTWRQVFFRFSTRQAMVLIITLSSYFAANRNNRIDDVMYLIQILDLPMFILIIITILFLVIRKASRPGRNAFPSGRPTQDGRDSGFFSGSRADVLTGRLRSFSRLVSEQRRARGEPSNDCSRRRG